MTLSPFSPPPEHEGPRRAHGVKMMNMALLLATMVDFASETWYELVNDDCGDRVVLFRSTIHADLAEISHMCHLDPHGAPGGHGYEPGGKWCCD